MSLTRSMIPGRWSIKILKKGTPEREIQRYVYLHGLLSLLRLDGAVPSRFFCRPLKQKRHNTIFHVALSSWTPPEQLFKDLPTFRGR